MAPSRPPPFISDYALIGDCRTAALISSDGSVDWLCLPHFSSTSVFAKLLDPRSGGHFSIRPRDEFSVTRRYVGDSAVLETTFRTNSGIARVLDFFPIVDAISSLQPMRELLRIVEGVSGLIDFCVELDARPDYGTTIKWPTNRGVLGWSYVWRNEILSLHTGVDLRIEPRAVVGTFAVQQGKREYFSLCYTINEPAIIPTLGNEADHRLASTIEWWSEWSAQVRYDGCYRDSVLRSAITLKLLTYALSGALIAAPTASLPEVVGADRNWDYRYCWLRDAGLTIQALMGLGINDDAKYFLDWLLHATRLSWPKLNVLYDVYGRIKIPEFELHHMAGYQDSRPVRIGNKAAVQSQLDVYGDVALAADTYVAGGGRIDPAGAKMLIGLGKVVCKEWRDRDSGIWEKRGKPQHYTFSKMMCWVALDRLLKLNDRGAISLDKKYKSLFQDERSAIEQYIESECFDTEVGSYMERAGSDLVDASVLLMPCVGYKDAHDPRVKSTFKLICERLRRSQLLIRYEPDPEQPKPPEGAFGICCFWEADQHAQRGELDRAESIFTHLLSLANDVGLYAEEFDLDTGTALGNFPQAFTHVGLINAAISIERARHKTEAAV